jgi:phosphatidate cytidylyltransferase
VLLLLANWAPHVVPGARDPWLWVVGTYVLVVLSAFVWEMAVYREPGQAVQHIALGGWIVTYLGLLPSFLVQLRFLPEPPGTHEMAPSSLALALAIFVPKMGDIGAYFTGRFLGRHHMTPVLSPKKTWEGCAGGLAAAVLTTLGVQALGPVLGSGCQGVIMAIGFGLTVGVAGILGDLAESLIKRDCQKKDASQVLPGFGGILDVVDAIIFAAPVAYGWIWLTN